MQIHRDFVYLWADPTAPPYKDQLLSAGFNTKEAIITLYSCLADDNLAWLFQLGGFEVTEARVEQGFSLTGCRAIGQQYKLFLPLIARNYQPFEPQLLGLQTDPAGDWIAPMPRPAYMDIRETRVWQTDAGHLRFELQLDDDIPATPPGWQFYGWFLDTDLDSSTGQHYNDIGSDYNVQVTYFPDRGWVGQIFDIIGGGLVELTSITVSGDTVTFTMPLTAIGSPSAFNWISIDQDDVPYYADIAPNTGHIHTELPTP
jgi:hypothetical protein